MNSLAWSELPEGFYTGGTQTTSAVFSNLFSVVIVVCKAPHILGDGVCICVCRYMCFVVVGEKVVAVGLGSVFGYTMIFSV